MSRDVPQSHINILRHMRKRPSRSSCQDICKPCRLSYYSFVEEDAQYLHRSRESMLLAQTQTPKIQYPPKLDLRSPQWLGGRKGCVTTLLARLSNTFNSDQLKGELAMKLVHRANTIFLPGSRVWESRVWGSRILGSRIWGSTELGQRISDLEFHMPVLKKNYRGPFNVNVV